MEPEEILVTEWGLWIQWVVNFFLSILHLLYIIYPNFTCVEFGIQIRTHKVAEYRIRIQNTTCDGNPAGKICQHVTTSWRQDLPACHYITPARFASMLLHTASMLFHTASKICQYVATYHQQDSPACCYILPACRFIPPARFVSMSLHTTSNICQHVATYRQHVATYTQQDLPACRYIPPARYASMSLHTAGKICQHVAATYRRQDLPACQCIPLTSFLSVSLWTQAGHRETSSGKAWCTLQYCTHLVHIGGGPVGAAASHSDQTEGEEGGEEGKEGVEDVALVVQRRRLQHHDDLVA